MWIKTIEEKFINKRWGQEDLRRIDVYVCDQCGSEHRTGYKAMHADPVILTFCNKECQRQSRKAGKLAQKVKNVNLERHGVEYGAQVSGAAEKMLATRVERFGTVAPIHYHDEIAQKWKSSMLESVGTEYPMQAESVKLKTVNSFQSRYGIDAAWSKGSKFRETSEEYSRWGVLGAVAASEQSISKPERELGEWLNSIFGIDDVFRQVFIAGLSVDFYINSLQLHIQMDGIYWHGLSLAIEKPDYVLRQMKRDSRMNEWFSRSNEYKLFRLSDIQWNWVTKNKECDTLLEQIMTAKFGFSVFDHKISYLVQKDDGLNH